MYVKQIYQRGNWEIFKSDLNQKYPDKLKFIEETVETIWQDDIVPEPFSLKEILKESWEDYKRLQEFRNTPLNKHRRSQHPLWKGIEGIASKEN